MISVIHPSYGRPQQAFNTIQNWRKKAHGQVEYILALDTRDELIEEYVKLFNAGVDNAKGEIHIISTDSTNCVQATNAAAKEATGDILVYGSDDFDCPNDWDVHIEVSMDTGYPQLLKVHDGLQKFENTVLTIPIMTRKLYDQLGYFWHPAYESMWVDVDLYYTTLPYHVYRPDLEFRHNHFSAGRSNYDPTYQQHDNKDRHHKGRDIINQRSKEMGWGARF